jgi:general secretion pathway protein J
MTRNLASQSGFTLTEVLVSLVVFSLVAAGTLALVMQASGSQRRLAEASLALRDLQTARAILSADLAQLAPRALSGQSVRFEGGGENGPNVTFIRAIGTPAGLDRTSLVAVEYALDGDGHLIRRSSTAIEAGPGAQVGERVLLPGADEFAFRFHDGLDWRDTWVGTQAVPRAVSLSASTPRYGRIEIAVLTGVR